MDDQTIAVFPGHGNIVVIRTDDGIEIHQSNPNDTEADIVYIPKYLIPALIEAMGQK